MNRDWVARGAILGALAVAIGAFGAHGLEERVSASALETWKTGAHYHLVHALVLVIVGLAWDHLGAARRPAAWLLLIGIVLFGGSLYALVLTNVRTWGAVAPLGGTALILGWIMLAAASLQRRDA